MIQTGFAVSVGKMDVKVIFLSCTSIYAYLKILETP